MAPGPCSTIARVKNWDVIVIGAGVIGLALARRLRADKLKVLIVERAEPASESTYAAGGMIADCDPHIPAVLQPLVAASAGMYPDFVEEIEDESGEPADLRDAGTITWFEPGLHPRCPGAMSMSGEEIGRAEPLVRPLGDGWLLPERSVDPRALGRALTKSTRQRAVDFVTGSTVLEVLTTAGRAAGVRTTHASYVAGTVVNCAGAWATQILPGLVPTRPVKGQMVCLIPAVSEPNEKPLIRHVLRTPGVYVIPRTDGRILLGATVEDAGFDKRVDSEIIKRLHNAALAVAPALSSMRIHDAWAGLRPASPDNLPILGETSLPGYFAATGHYRDGIMLAPVTALVMVQLMGGSVPDLDLQPFSPLRFG